MARKFLADLWHAIATPAATPRAGSFLIYVKSDGHLYRKDSLGAETQITENVVAVGGGGGTPSGAELDLTTDFETTTPAAPSVGITLFARFRARRTVAFIGPTGLDTSLQPALFSNRVFLWTASANSTSGTQFGAAITTSGTASAVTINSGAFYTSMARVRYTSAATANSLCGLNTTAPQFQLSSITNLGGFFATYRFGVPSGAGRLAAGLIAGASYGAAGPTVQFIGFWGDYAAGGNWQFQTVNSAGARTVVDLGSSFPATSAEQGVAFYEFRLFAPSGSAGQVWWSATRLNDGVTVQGTATATLPSAGQFLSSRINYVTPAATAVVVDVQTLYVETDN